MPESEARLVLLQVGREAGLEEGAKGGGGADVAKQYLAFYGVWSQRL